MSRFLTRRLALLTAAAWLLTLPGTASAGDRPYRANGTATISPTGAIVGSGKATHLGPYSEEGSVAFAPTADPTVFSVTGSVTYTADNGSLLHANVDGLVNFATGAITATLTYDGGTGRFADATGTSTLTGQLGAGGVATVSVAGIINY